MAEVSSLWLTEEEKQRHLAHLAGRIEAGEVDEEIIPLLDTINAYPDMVTVQSCSGHRGKPKPEVWMDTVSGHNLERSVEYLSDGHIQIRTTKQLSDVFCEHAATLAIEEEICQVSLTWGRSNTYQQQECPLWEFVFAGLNESPVALAASTAIIAKWLCEALAARRDNHA